jgi:hypothetical protein
MYRNVLFGAALALVLVLATWGQQTTKPAAPPPAAKQAATTDPQDEEIARLKLEHERLKKQAEIEELKRENALLAGAPQEQGQTLPAKPLTPEEELKRLEAERERLLAERQVEILRKQNEALRGPVASPPPPPEAPAAAAKPCTPKSGPKVNIRPAPKATSWMCRFGICPEDKPVAVIGTDGCPGAPAPSPANAPLNK